MSKKVNTPAKAATNPGQSKRAQLIKLLERDNGATLDAMVALTGWLPHTTRAALTGLRKKGHIITSDKIDGVRTYRAAANRVAAGGRRQSSASLQGRPARARYCL